VAVDAACRSCPAADRLGKDVVPVSPDIPSAGTLGQLKIN
jgi:hypothetical protein